MLRGDVSGLVRLMVSVRVKGGGMHEMAMVVWIGRQPFFLWGFNDRFDESELFVSSPTIIAFYFCVYAGAWPRLCSLNRSLLFERMSATEGVRFLEVYIHEYVTNLTARTSPCSNPSRARYIHSPRH